MTEKVERKIRTYKRPRVHWRVPYGLKNMANMVHLLTVGASS